MSYSAAVNFSLTILVIVGMTMAAFWILRNRK